MTEDSRKCMRIVLHRGKLSARYKNYVKDIITIYEFQLIVPTGKIMV